MLFLTFRAYRKGYFGSVNLKPVFCLIHPASKTRVLPQLSHVRHHNVFVPTETKSLASGSALNGLVQPLEALENKLEYFLERFPEFRKTLKLAVVHEEEGLKSYGYFGWKWHDVETHPTKLLRLVTEGIASINLRTRQATSYLLKNRQAVKRVLYRREQPSL